MLIRYVSRTSHHLLQLLASPHTRAAGRLLLTAVIAIVAACNSLDDPSLGDQTLNPGTPNPSAAMAPSIVTNPLSATSAIGGNATFAVIVTGTAPFTYQWRKDGLAIEGATAASYTVSAVRPADGGVYDVVVTNPAGTAVSSQVTLTVLAA